MLFSKEMPKSLQRLEEEIEVYESSLDSSGYDEELAQRIIQTKRKRNLLIPINQLPTELLIDIFGASIGKSSKRFERLRTIASVAWLWNSIVKRAPGLWAVLDSHVSTELFPIILRRAGDFPLTITMQESNVIYFSLDPDEEPEDRNTTFLKMVLPKLGRWKEAGLLFESSERNLLERLENPAPLLQRCILEASGFSRVPQVDLFQGQAPRLTEMTLERVPIRWNSNVFRNLRSLWMWGIMECGPTVEEVLQYILSSPCLEYFHLSGSGLSSSTLHQDISTVELPHLKSLNLSGLSSSSTQLLLSRIRAPALYRLIVQPNPPDASDDNQLLTFLNACLLHFSPTIYASISRTRCLRISASGPTGTISVSTPQDLEHNEGILMDFHHQPIILGLQLCLGLLLRNGSARPPISLVLDEVDSIPETHLLWIFDSEINEAVTEVEIRSFGDESFLPFLCKAKYLRGAARWPLPKLNKLHLSSGAAVSGEVVARLLRQRYAPDSGELSNTLTPGSQTRLIVETPDRLTSFDVEDTPVGSFDYDNLCSILGLEPVGENFQGYDY
ncbi:hypothetical protein FRC00_007991 [Tulasnella sp. 408]|nr:hypothetical protein FRC00_007991 [Tulasnella sp. 408]